jgi:hypothetical protein
LAVPNTERIKWIDEQPGRDFEGGVKLHIVTGVSVFWTQNHALQRVLLMFTRETGRFTRDGGFCCFRGVSNLRLHSKSSRPEKYIRRTQGQITSWF